MFTRDDGSLMNKDYLLGAFRRVLKSTSLPHYVPYDLRHTYATLLLAEGAPITYVSAQLGHSNPSTTLRFYARWMASKGRGWVNVLDGRKVSPRKGEDWPVAEPVSGIVEPQSGTKMERA